MGTRVFAIASFAALVVAGCSKGTPADHPDGDTNHPDAHHTADAADHIDAAEVPDAPPGLPDAPGTPDATPPLPDAAPPPDAHLPVSITLTQNIDSTTITDLNSVSCNSGINAENSYYRAFTLSDHGVVGALTINSVGFGVEQALGGITTSQPATIKLYTYTGATGGTTLDSTQFTPLASLNISIADANDTLLSFPMTAIVPAGGTVVMELFIPDATATSDLFFIGSNAAGQIKPSYLRAPDCGAAIPTSVASLGFPNMDQIMTVTGTYTP